MQAQLNHLQRRLDTLSLQCGLQSALLEEALDLLQECHHRINRIERFISLNLFSSHPNQTPQGTQHSA